MLNKAVRITQMQSLNPASMCPQVDPQGSSKAKSLSIDVDVSCASKENGLGTSESTSPGPQIDERSPDARVYRTAWNTDWLQTDQGRIPRRRTRLPEPAEATPSFNIWSIIKDFVGKDITHLSVPAHICEPTTELQRRAEGMLSAELLDQAAECPAYSRQRLLLVTAFAVSIYSKLTRATKPFKDLLHSTYELIYPEKGYRLIAEKVAHTPATTAMLCEGRKWRFLAYDESHLEFSLQCYIRLKPVGVMSVTFSDGDVYEWNQVPIYIQGLVVGPINLDHKGISQVICKATGSRTKLKISCQGALSRVWRGNCHMGLLDGLYKNLHYLSDSPMLTTLTSRAYKKVLYYQHKLQVNGCLMEAGEAVTGLEIMGAWDQSLSVKYPDGTTEVLWKVAAPSASPQRYNFSTHTAELNELLPEMEIRLPKTDVRLRPDMRLLEDGYAVKANVVKDKLEEQQRAKRQKCATQGEPRPAAQWFECIPPLKEGDLPRWRYKGGYWECRETGNWPQVADLYDIDLSKDDMTLASDFLQSRAKEVII